MSVTALSPGDEKIAYWKSCPHLRAETSCLWFSADLNGSPSF